MGNIKIILMIIVWLIFAGTVHASTVDISVTTNKSTYQLGEYVTVYVIAYNPNAQAVTLNFPTALQATYWIDDNFDWTEGKVFGQEPTIGTISAESSYTWNRIHGSAEMSLYPLNLGTHTVATEVVGYGDSATVQFGVVPEPSTLAIFGFALPFFRASSRRKT